MLESQLAQAEEARATAELELSTAQAKMEDMQRALNAVLRAQPSGRSPTGRGHDTSRLGDEAGSRHSRAQSHGTEHGSELQQAINSALAVFNAQEVELDAASTAASSQTTDWWRAPSAQSRPASAWEAEALADLEGSMSDLSHSATGPGDLQAALAALQSEVQDWRQRMVSDDAPQPDSSTVRGRAALPAHARSTQFVADPAAPPIQLRMGGSMLSSCGSACSLPPQPAQQQAEAAAADGPSGLMVHGSSMSAQSFKQALAQAAAEEQASQRHRPAPMMAPSARVPGGRARRGCGSAAKDDCSSSGSSYGSAQPTESFNVADIWAATTSPGNTGARLSREEGLRPLPGKSRRAPSPRQAEPASHSRLDSLSDSGPSVVSSARSGQPLSPTARHAQQLPAVQVRPNAVQAARGFSDAVVQLAQAQLLWFSTLARADRRMWQASSLAQLLQQSGSADGTAAARSILGAAKARSLSEIRAAGHRACLHSMNLCISLGVGVRAARRHDPQRLGTSAPGALPRIAHSWGSRACMKVSAAMVKQLAKMLAAQHAGEPLQFPGAAAAAGLPRDSSAGATNSGLAAMGVAGLSISPSRANVDVRQADISHVIATALQARGLNVPLARVQEKLTEMVHPPAMQPVQPSQLSVMGTPNMAASTAARQHDPAARRAAAAQAAGYRDAPLVRISSFRQSGAASHSSSHSAMAPAPRGSRSRNPLWAPKQRATEKDAYLLALPTGGTQMVARGAGAQLSMADQAHVVGAPLTAAPPSSEYSAPFPHEARTRHPAGPDTLSNGSSIDVDRIAREYRQRAQAAVPALQIGAASHATGPGGGAGPRQGRALLRDPHYNPNQVSSHALGMDSALSGSALLHSGSTQLAAASLGSQSARTARVRAAGASISHTSSSQFSLDARSVRLHSSDAQQQFLPAPASARAVVRQRSDALYGSFQPMSGSTRTASSANRVAAPAPRSSQAFTLPTDRSAGLLRDYGAPPQAQDSIGMLTISYGKK